MRHEHEAAATVTVYFLRVFTSGNLAGIVYRDSLDFPSAVLASQWAVATSKRGGAGWKISLDDVLIRTVDGWYTALLHGIGAPFRHIVGEDGRPLCGKVSVTAADVDLTKSWGPADPDFVHCSECATRRASR